jgi:signal transduction histidine kinase
MSPDPQNSSSFANRSGKEQAARFNSYNDLNGKNQQEANRQSEQQLSSIQTLNPNIPPVATSTFIPSPGDAKILSSKSEPKPNLTATEFEKIAAQAFRLPAPQTLSAEIMRPLWLPGNQLKGQASADTLVLARRVRVDSTDWLQACWLDWPLIREQLLTSIHDLLPDADVVPVADSSSMQPHRLATLPLMLVPGNALPDWEEPTTSSATLPMIGAWSGVLIALIAGGVLLGGALALSERRGAFVSAVTHELRTPLTTFRLYTDLLADGQITDAKERQRCLDTLRVEADRLGHLVENVLGYAQLERNPLPTTALGIAALIDGMRERLSERAGRVGLELITSVTPDTQALAVRGEAQAIERVLVNLVDNACKYAAKAADRRLHLDVARHGNDIGFTIRDHGPGIPADLIGKLFTPFAKSAAEAAITAPGIGLGLALSRRLARQLGGDLTSEPPKDGGAAFALTLPRA